MSRQFLLQCKMAISQSTKRETKYAVDLYCCKAYFCRKESHVEIPH